MINSKELTFGNKAITDQMCQGYISPLLTAPFCKWFWSGFWVPLSESQPREFGQAETLHLRELEEFVGMSVKHVWLVGHSGHAFCLLSLKTCKFSSAVAAGPPIVLVMFMWLSFVSPPSPFLLDPLTKV